MRLAETPEEREQEKLILASRIPPEQVEYWAIKYRRAMRELKQRIFIGVIGTLVAALSLLTGSDTGIMIGAFTFAFTIPGAIAVSLAYRHNKRANWWFLVEYRLDDMAKQREAGRNAKRSGGG